jgi:hypothetical protein
MDDPKFQAGEISTGFMEQFLAAQSKKGHAIGTMSRR